MPSHGLSPDSSVARRSSVASRGMRSAGSPSSCGSRSGQVGAPNGVPVGRSGGLPRLPVGMRWPSSESSPLPFIASFDCAALPRIDGLALPADGSLLFFLHHEDAYDAFSVAGEQEHARVVYVPAGTDTATAEEPDHPEEVFCDTELGFVGREYDLPHVKELPETAMAQDNLEAREKAGELVIAPDESHLRLEQE